MSEGTIVVTSRVEEEPEEDNLLGDETGEGVGLLARDSAHATYGVGETGSITTAAAAPLLAFWKVYWIALVVSMDYNVILPVIYQFTDKGFHAGLIFYGAVLSCNSVAETIGALILGYWSDRRPIREPVICALILIALGNALYVLAWDFGVWAVLVGRVIAGSGAGAAGVLIAFVTHNSALHERNKRIGEYWLVALSTNIWGPIVCLLITQLKLGMNGMFNVLSAPAIFTMIFSILNAVFVFFWPKYVSHHVSSKQAQLHVSNSSSAKSMVGWAGFVSMWRSVSGVAFVCLWIKFMFALCVAAFSAIGAPISEEDAGGGGSGSGEPNAEDQALRMGFVYLYIGGMILLGVFLGKILSKKISDFTLLQIGQVVVIVGLFFGIAWPGLSKEGISFFLFIASFFLTIGNSLGVNLSTTVFSKAVGQYHPQKGALMGWFVTMGAMARIIGPILATAGLGSVGLSLICGILILGVLVGTVALMYQRVKVGHLQVAENASK